MKQQRGGFVLGMIIGLLVGLALALAVALYVTKTPVPFVNKVPQRSAEQDAAEVERNKNWDPNAPLGGKAASRPAPSPSPAPAPAVVAVPAAPSKLPEKPTERAPVAAVPAVPAPALSTKPGADTFNYFVQAGAFSRNEEAEQQRAKLAMQGLEAKVSEREQSGRTVYRVRLGPFDKQEQAEAARDKLAGAGFEAVLVRVQK
jgi:cell division protein FtsN